MSDFNTYTPPSEPEPVAPEPQAYTPDPAPYDPNVTSDDKLWAMLSYIFTPIIPIIVLLLDDKKNRPFLKAHVPQALVWGVVGWLITAITSPILIGCIIGPAVFIISLIWGLKANKGEYINIPVITDFVKKQGW